MDTPANEPQIETPHQARTVTVVIDGKEEVIPWAFTNPKIEGRAAKKHGIDYPATSRKDQ
jgi:hypothetical protein